MRQRFFAKAQNDTLSYAMKKYLQIIKGTWAEYMMYRLNFVMWRVRMVMQILVVYFLWWAIFSQRQAMPAGRQEFFGYSQSMILTYILLSSLVRTLVLGTTTMDIGSVINQGNLSNFLLRPLHFFHYYIARDIGDKLLNFAFAVVEVTILYFLLRPPIFIQTNGITLLLFLAAIIMGTILYFFFSLIFGFLGFWTPDVWAPRFLSFVIMEFFAGGLFPLDILPKPIFFISQLLPFSYFLYFPLKVYLGQLTMMTILEGFVIGIAWVAGLTMFASLLWQKGLKVYTAEGR